MKDKPASKVMFVYMEAGKECLAIQWIPVLPRSVSRYVVKNKLYWLFSQDRVVRFPFIFQYLTDWRLLRGMPLSLKRRLALKQIKNSFIKMEKEEEIR